MAALDFPANPYLNQVYQNNGRLFVWNGRSWSNEPKTSTDDLEEYEPWVRNPDWIEMPAIPSNEDKIQLIFAVNRTESNWTGFVASIWTTTHYNVDWGDGSTSVVNSGICEQHNYNFDDLDPSTEFYISGEVHRQALIVITPETGGYIFGFNLNFADVPGAWGTDYFYLDCYINCVNIWNANLSIGAMYKGLSRLERVIINCPYLTSCNRLFENCGLREIQFISDTSSITNWASAFAGCSSLRTIPELNLSGATEMSYMFNNCSSITKVPTLLPTGLLGCAGMYANCYNLKRAPMLNTSLVTSFENMHLSNHSLIEVPHYDTSAGQNFFGMFQNCYVLREIPHYNTSSGTNFGNMFYSCGLRAAPLLDLSSATSMSQMFFYCGAEIPAFNTSNVVDMTYLFYGGGPQFIPFLDTSSVENAYGMFMYSSIKKAPAFNLSSCTNATNMFYASYGLTEAPLTGLAASIDFLRADLTTGAIVDLFNGLSTVTGGQVLSLYQVTDAGSLTSGQLAIATSKGWTISI